MILNEPDGMDAPNSATVGITLGGKELDGKTLDNRKTLENGQNEHRADHQDFDSMRRGSYVIPSCWTEVDKTRKSIVEQLAFLTYNRREVVSISTALAEALSNALMHGNEGDRNKSISVAYTATEQEFWARVQDEGGGFDPQSVADPTLPENLLRTHGRGMRMMEHFMSEVKVIQPGNCVVLRLLRDRSATDKQTSGALESYLPRFSDR